MPHRRIASLLTFALIFLLVFAGACRPTPTPEPPTATPIPPTSTPLPTDTPAPAEPPEEPTPAFSGNVAEIVASAPQLTILAAAIEDADLVEKLSSDGPYVFGDEVSAADVFLVPQVYNARRFNVDVSDFPKLVRIDAECLQLDAFSEAVPENQLDAKPA